MRFFSKYCQQNTQTATLQFTSFKSKSTKIALESQKNMRRKCKRIHSNVNCVIATRPNKIAGDGADKNSIEIENALFQFHRYSVLCAVTRVVHFMSHQGKFIYSIFEFELVWCCHSLQSVKIFSTKRMRAWMEKPVQSSPHLTILALHSLHCLHLK